MSYRRVQKESDELYTVWSLVMVREPAQGVKRYESVLQEYIMNVLCYSRVRSVDLLRL